MLIIQLLLAAVILGLVIGFALLARLVLTRFAHQQTELDALRRDMTRLLGDAEEGELLRAVRDLHAVQKRDEEARAARHREDDRYTALSDESRWERDWKRAFESDR